MTQSLDSRASLIAATVRRATVLLRRPLVTWTALALLGASVAIPSGFVIANLAPYENPSGIARTYSTAGVVDMSNAFFQNLGSNGRTCLSCHQPGEGWTITPAGLQARFDATDGLDPVFRTNDGADCPSADTSTTDARRRAYSMLLRKGLIRVSMGVPDFADFSVTSIRDPHGCRDTSADALALFRRPLPSANLRFLTTVMWDGRESFGGQSLDFNLSHQAVDATLGHAQAFMSPTTDQVEEIVRFETALSNAQSEDFAASDLGARGARGGPVPLSQQEFYVGINDPLGGNPTGAPFDPEAFTLFREWLRLDGEKGSVAAARASIARGEALFNTVPITISGVTGLNDLPGVPASFQGTCTTCHDTPNVGNHSVALAINIGVADYPALPALDTTGLPVYTIRCDAKAAAPLNRSRTFQTTDPARALITGKCVDVGKTKGPILRGLAARAPYFHNGSARTLRDVVNFYDQRFGIGLTETQKADMVAFLGAL